MILQAPWAYGMLDQDLVQGMYTAAYQAGQLPELATEPACLVEELAATTGGFVAATGDFLRLPQHPGQPMPPVSEAGVRSGSPDPHDLLIPNCAGQLVANLDAELLNWLS